MDDIARAALEVLLEDFKARWQELLNIEGEINTWTITYLTALFLTVAWVLGQKSKETLTRLFKEQRMLLLSIAVINASYMLMLFSKDYRLQQDALYIYQVIAPRVADITGEPFNTWEEWRRQNTLTWGRFIYNLMIALPAVAISVLILARYAHDERPWQKGNRLTLRNIYAYAVVLFNALALTVAVSSMVSVSHSWRKAIVEQESRNQRLTALDLSPRSAVVVRDTIRSLQRLGAATEVGVDLATYSSLLSDSKMRATELLAVLSSGDLPEEIDAAVVAFLDAKRAWELSLKQEDYLSTNNAQFQGWNRTYDLGVDMSRVSRIHRDSVLQVMWKTARSHTISAAAKIQQPQ
jgi:MFS family permease